ncbi:MAG: zinc-dependent metalloprotease [Bifidobacteriaceae bacterium]|jgi:coenzyme F420 biosynthesis associated uncharacterized protein|nr:zinc-dependent metalloprotease [Bifidobacteriaceae bacterium]
MVEPVNWALAARVGAAVARPGPRTTRAEAVGLVAELRESAAAAVDYIEQITGLTAAAEAASRLPVLIVDRLGFVRANVGTVHAVADRLVTEPASFPGRQVAGVQTGVVFALLAARTLGQFDPYGAAALRPGPAHAASAGARVPAHAAPAPEPAGRLLVVAPNVLRFERELDVDPSDFRLWVVLHEQTHAVQFCAAPWLPAHLLGLLGRLLAEEEGGDLAQLLDTVRRLPRSLTEPDAHARRAGPADGVLTQTGRDLFDQVTAVMSLLEGHADVIMDAVGPKVVRTIEEIRPKFDARRAAGGRWERAVRRLAGLDAKLAQYRDGAAFVRGVLARVGHEGLAAAFVAPANLPTPAEIADPAAWVARVHG